MQTMTNHQFQELTASLGSPLRVMVMKNPAGLIVIFPASQPGETWLVDTMGRIERRLTARRDGRVGTDLTMYQVERHLAAEFLDSVQR